MNCFEFDLLIIKSTFFVNSYKFCSHDSSRTNITSLYVLALRFQSNLINVQTQKIVSIKSNNRGHVIKISNTVLTNNFLGETWLNESICSCNIVRFIVQLRDNDSAISSTLISLSLSLSLSSRFKLQTSPSSIRSYYIDTIIDRRTQFHSCMKRRRNEALPLQFCNIVPSSCHSAWHTPHAN